MEIIFGAPPHKVSGIIVGAENGVLRSNSFKGTPEELGFLIEKTQKLHERFPKKNVVFQPFWCEMNGTHVMVQVADLTKTEFSEADAYELGARIFTVAATMAEEEVLIDFSYNFSPGTVACIAAGFGIRSFSFDKYKKNDPDKIKVKKVYFISSNQDLTMKAYKDTRAVVDAVAYVRYLASEAPNVLDPEMLANEAKNLKKFGVKVDILDEKAIAKLGMNALLGVAQGSVRAPYVAVCHWNGGDKNDAPIALVGKGVTFDSGGISIKPSSGMHEMKEDMTGAAIVLSTMQLAAQIEIPLNLIGIIGLVENMPSGSAQRPSDIVVSMSGLTIEVQNTDAEGRLVLADLLYYVENEFSPQYIIDFATLTGAIKVALGQEFAGLFSNDNTLSKKLIAAGETVKERLWRLPLDPSFDKDIDSNIADVKNVGSGRGAGSITAAHFLNRFLLQKTPWAHLDIAAVTYDSKDRPLTGVGFTGFGVRLMYAFLKNLTHKDAGNRDD
ncbi:MAG: leucyl aminopeptidase [Holosporales bacterium]|jgi:leucyl aminopeptidase|nr:leucyl aminopeptidase [Holosporales bacterium]